MLSAGLKTKINQRTPPGRSVYHLHEKKKRNKNTVVCILIIEEKQKQKIFLFFLFFFFTELCSVLKMFYN